MGIFAMFRRAQEQKSEPEIKPEPETTNPIEEKLKQSDAARLDAQKARLAALTKKEQEDLVPEGGTVEQREADAARQEQQQGSSD